MEKLMAARGIFFLATVLVTSAAQLAPSKDAPPREPSAAVELLSTSEIDLQLLTRRAALIFAGTVTEVDMNEKKQQSANESDTGVAIKFQVDEGIRGVGTGEQLTIREWRGLWNRGHGQRYRVGDRMLIFYHHPSAQGFSSPVSGDAGRFAIKAIDKILLTAPQRRALMRASRLHTNPTEAQIASGEVKSEQVAKMVRQMVAEQ